ncbi:MAG: hypothetical protein H3Z52_13845, partial [archaeon]|nr:hypothetical protein [archaeon]
MDLSLLYITDLDLRLGGGQRRSYETITRITKKVSDVTIISIGEVWPPCILDEIASATTSIHTMAIPSRKMRWGKFFHNIE